MSSCLGLGRPCPRTEVLPHPFLGTGPRFTICLLVPVLRTRRPPFVAPAKSSSVVEGEWMHPPLAAFQRDAPVLPSGRVGGLQGVRERHCRNPGALPTCRARSGEILAGEGAQGRCAVDARFLEPPNGQRTQRIASWLPGHSSGSCGRPRSERRQKARTGSEPGLGDATSSTQRTPLEHSGIRNVQGNGWSWLVGWLFFHVYPWLAATQGLPSTLEVARYIQRQPNTRECILHHSASPLARRLALCLQYRLYELLREVDTFAVVLQK